MSVEFCLRQEILELEKALIEKEKELEVLRKLLRERGDE